VPGQEGFGVGICPSNKLPAGMVSTREYGNYQYKDGSIMCWIPRFYYRIAHASNPTYSTYALNSVDIKGIDFFANTTDANTAGYALHRAFIDGGIEKDGFFVDKYKCSKNVSGLGYIASSIPSALPLSTAAAHNPIADLTLVQGSTTLSNYYYHTLEAPHHRDGIDGNVNANSIFFCCSKFIHSALGMLSLAHGQAATSTSSCAWYNTTYNYPKGCNNDALKDIDDTSVIWKTDGYLNCGKTGSAGYDGGVGNVFAKSTHNGQNSGVADVNGLMYETSIGITCVATTKSVTGASKAATCVVTTSAVAHGFSNGDIVMITGVVGMTEINDRVYVIANVTTYTFELSGVNSSAYGVWSSGGTITKGTWYVAKQATSMKSFTSGDNAAATDHWGASGIGQFDTFVPPFGSGDVFAQKYGSGSNQVLSEVISGAGYILTGLGFPKDENGMDTTGSNLFGKDRFYCYVIDKMCLLVCGYWDGSAIAGVWHVDWYGVRDASHYYVGFRAACYLV
jgi:hypothetical protein